MSDLVPSPASGGDPSVYEEGVVSVDFGDEKPDEEDCAEDESAPTK